MRNFYLFCHTPLVSVCSVHVPLEPRKLNLKVVLKVGRYVKSMGATSALFEYIQNRPKQTLPRHLTILSTEINLNIYWSNDEVNLVIFFADLDVIFLLRLEMFPKGETESLSKTKSLHTFSLPKEFCPAKRFGYSPLTSGEKSVLRVIHSSEPQSPGRPYPTSKAKATYHLVLQCSFKLEAPLTWPPAVDDHHCIA